MKREKSKTPISESSGHSPAQGLVSADIPRLVSGVHEALSDLADPARKEGQERYFKGTINSLGIPMAEVLMVGRHAGQSLRRSAKAVVFEACDALFRDGGFEASIIACHWSRLPRKQYEAKDIKVFGRWLDKYVGNWATCDTFCNHTVAMLVEKYPVCLDSLLQWSRSPNRWVRRGAATSLIVPAKKGLYTDTIFAIARSLLRDDDDMVQKGYGWMLKEAYRAHPAAVEAFVMQHRKDMPRTAFRYAIEKWPPVKRKSAMES